MIDQPIRIDHEMPASGAPAAVQNLSHQSRTTLVERVLIVITIAILPLENQFPTVAGMSASFLIFAVLGAYVIVNRPRVLGRVWQHPVFIAAYVFIGVSALLEFSSPLSRYTEIFRFGSMIGGAVFLSAFCRDRSGLAAGLYGYIVAALWVSIFLFLTSYGVVKGMGQVEGFNEATKVRQEAFGDKGIQANLNTLAFACTQGAVIAFTLALLSNVKSRRILFFGIATVCLIASFLPMSRGAALITILSFAVVLYTHGFKHGKVLILASILGMSIYMLVPDAVWSRMAYSTESTGNGRMEGRAWIYTTALNRLPEYFVAGVGSGNYNSKWGIEKGFAKEYDGFRVVVGAHNSLLQVTIFWGGLGLLPYLWIIWCAYRSIPLRCGRDELSLALLGIIVSLSLWMCESHGFYDKWFACGLGMLVGARQWIWPSGIVSVVEVNQGRGKRFDGYSLIGRQK